MTPLSLAFPHLREDSNWTATVLIIDLLFLVDIFINFFSAYEDADLRIQDDRKLIAINYLKGWFNIDVIAIFPVEIILEISQGKNRSTHGGTVNQLVRIARIGKIYRLIKITRLLRLLKVNQRKGTIMDQM